MFLNTDRAAEYTGFAVPTLAKLRCRKIGPRYHKYGRKVVYRQADLDAWLDSRLVASTEVK